MYDNLEIMTLSEIDRDDTLNIFTDASVKSTPEGYSGCYGAIAVCHDTVLDDCYRIVTHTTSNNCEIKGVRAGVNLALKFRDQFPIINLFSDSQISIFGIRDRLTNWRLDTKGNFRTISGDIVSSQEIYVEIARMIVDNNLRINFLHQKGHVGNSIGSITNAQHVFMTSNSIRCKVTLNLINYISKWNNVVDNTSRDILREYNGKLVYQEAIEYIPSEFDRARYNELIGNKNNRWGYFG